MLGLSACGSDDASDGRTCSVEDQTGCDAGRVCESVDDGSVGCFAPLVVRGRVVETADSASLVEGAIVAARDVNGEMVSLDTTASDEDGRYELAVPALRRPDGSPITAAITLRADAAGFATFPSGLRVGVPIDATSPSREDGRWIVENASTDVALDRLPSVQGLGTVRGRIAADGVAGTLVVAGTGSGLASRDGSFTLFNVPAGSVEVRAYRIGLALGAATVEVRAGALTDGVELAPSAEALARVEGDVNFVNAGSQETSIVLVVESTFNEALARGEVPAGFRRFPVTGPYAFDDVPPGRYVVLAAFENDGLVRDPDTSIGGTAIQHIEVASAPVSVTGFKITGALDVMGPGAVVPESVTGTPVFRWADDSSEDGYELTVYDTFGRVVHRDPEVPRVTGSSDVEAAYTGPALAPGYYQFRAVSYRVEQDARTYISATEDLKGVFVIDAP